MESSLPLVSPVRESFHSAYDGAPLPQHHVQQAPPDPSQQSSSTPSICKPISTQKRKQRQFVLWWPQSIAMLFSVALLVAIVAVLLAFHNKPLDAWNMPWQIKPNTLISILMTLCRLTMLVVVADCIGQLKWVYFQQQQHPLSHFQTFDDASRGPWGALLLLFSIRWRAAIASLGALVTILALAMEPFTQQVLSYAPHNSTERSAALWKATSYDYATPLYLLMPDEPAPRPAFGLSSTTDMTGSILASLSSVADSMKFRCETGNCTWNAFTSLGICSSCKNVSSSLQGGCSVRKENTGLDVVSRGACQYTTPAGSDLSVLYSYERHALSATSQQYTIWNSTSPDNDHANISETTKLPILARLSSIKLSGGWMEGACEKVSDLATCIVPQPEAYDCELSWCEKSYDWSSVINGTLLDLTTKESPLHFPFEPSRDYPAMSPYLDTRPYDIYDQCLGLNASTWTNETKTYENGTTYFRITGQGTGVGHEVQPLRLAAVSNQSPDGRLNSDCPSFENNTEPPGTYWINYADSQSIGEALRSIFTQEMDDYTSSSLAQVLYGINDGNFSKTLDNVAIGMTNNIRQGPNATVTDGNTVTLVIKIQVNWPWLIYPACLVLLTILFMVTTLLFSAENSQVVWKSSSLAVLFHGLEGWTFDELNVRGASDMGDAAKNMQASLMHDGDGALKLVKC